MRLSEVVRRLFTKRVTVAVTEGRRRKTHVVEVEPSGNVVYAFILSLVMLTCLSALQIAYLIVMHEWNSEIFTVISGLVGTITGMFLGAKS